MAGGKETPRQKMIGMMYLVLMAMLALNVTRQVLNAFSVVNEGLKVTNHDFDEKNESTMFLFKKAMDQDAKKTKPFYDKAVQVKQLSEAFCVHLDSLKYILLTKTDPYPWDTAKKIILVDERVSKENFDVTTRILINENAAEDGSKGEAHSIKMRLGDYRKKLLGFLPNPKDSVDVNIGLLTPDMYNKADGKMENWEYYNFYDSPLAACVVSLTMIQNNIKNAEASVITDLLSSIDAGSYKVNHVVGEIIPKETYVTLGDSFHAQIFLAASQSTQMPIVTIDSINGKAVEKINVPVSGGTGYYSVKPTTEGPESFAGTIAIKKPGDNTYDKYPFHSSYLAAKPSVVVSPTAMNVFYIGVDNPVSISAAGYANSDLQPSCSGGSLTKTATGYVVRIAPGAKISDPQKGPFCLISVSGKQPDGSHKSLGQPAQFRIKRVPPPICAVGGQEGDITMSKAELGIYTKVEAKMENFDFNLHYDVTSFNMFVQVGSEGKQLSSSSNLFTDEMKKYLHQMQTGSRIIISNVNVRGPDGAKKLPQGLTITVK